MIKTRRNRTPEFKAQVVLELLREEMTVNELAAKHQISPVLNSRWKAELIERAAEVFKKGPSEAEKELVAKVVVPTLPELLSNGANRPDSETVYGTAAFVVGT